MDVRILGLAGARTCLAAALAVGGVEAFAAAGNGSAPDELAALKALVARPGFFATPKAERKVLLVAQAWGYRHEEAMAWGSKALALVGDKGAFKLTRRDDGNVLTDAAYLAQFDAIVLNNTTTLSEKRFPGMSKALTDYVRSGKGICFIHSALDAFYDSPEVQEMAGGLFFGHPWPAASDCLYVNEKPDHPLNAAFGGREKFR